MDGLVTIAILYFVVTMIVRSKKTMSAQQQDKARHEGADGAEARANGDRAAKSAAAAPKKNTQTFHAKSAYQPMEPSASIGEGQSRMEHSLQMRMKEAAPPRITEYVGSLGGGSTEGMDTCDQSLGHQDADDAFYAQGTVYTGQIGAEEKLAWNAKTIVQGVVMSEILKRPSERKWGRA